MSKKVKKRKSNRQIRREIAMKAQNPTIQRGLKTIKERILQPILDDPSRPEHEGIMALWKFISPYYDEKLANAPDPTPSQDSDSEKTEAKPDSSDTSSK